MIRDFTRTAITRVLTDITAKMAEKARQNASWSSTIPGAISVLPVQEVGEMVFVGTIEVDLNEAPEAAAFEFGSGVHRKEGAGEYLITSRTAGKMLAIPAERWPNKLYDDDPAYLPYVWHPGVKARPYLSPAVDGYKPTMKERLVIAMAKAFVDGIRIEFTRT